MIAELLASNRSLARLLLDVHATGFDDFPERLCLLACNHLNRFDPSVASLAVPRTVECLTPGQLDIPSALAEKVRHPHCLALFPEEKPVPLGDSFRFASAAAHLAYRLGCPIRTCLILGTERLHRWGNWLRRPTIQLVSGCEFRADRALPPRAAEYTLASLVEADFRRLDGRFYHAVAAAGQTAKSFPSPARQPQPSAHPLP